MEALVILVKLGIGNKAVNAKLARVLLLVGVVRLVKVNISVQVAKADIL